MSLTRFSVENNMLQKTMKGKSTRKCLVSERETFLVRVSQPDTGEWSLESPAEIMSRSGRLPPLFGYGIRTFGYRNRVVRSFRIPRVAPRTNPRPLVGGLII